MGKYLDIAKKVQRELSERSELTRSSIVSAVPLNNAMHSGKRNERIPVPPTILDLCAPLDALHQLYTQQCANRPDGIARVRLSDWRAMCGMDEWQFWRVLKELEREDRIIREWGYARPSEG